MFLNSGDAVVVNSLSFVRFLLCGSFRRRRSTREPLSGPSWRKPYGRVDVYDYFSPNPHTEAPSALTYKYRFLLTIGVKTAFILWDGVVHSLHLPSGPYPPYSSKALSAALTCPLVVWFGFGSVRLVPPTLAALVWFIFREIYDTDGSPDIFRWGWRWYRV